jgi:DNA-binding CsgD family transcriptional regulator
MYTIMQACSDSLGDPYAQPVTWAVPAPSAPPAPSTSAAPAVGIPLAMPSGFGLPFMPPPLMFFWMACTYFLARIFFTQQHKPEKELRNSKETYLLWIMVGVTMGMTTLSKYHIVFLLAGAFIFALTSEKHRHWVWHPGPYIALVLNFLFALPIFIWNAQHEWISFLWQGGRAGSDGLELHWDWLFRSIGGQSLWLLPWIWVPLIMVLFKVYKWGKRGDAFSWFCFWVAVLPIVFFTVNGSSREHLVEAVETSLGIEEVTRLDKREEETLIRAHLTDPKLASLFDSPNSLVRSVTIDPGAVSVVVDVPETEDVREFITWLEQVLPSLELRSRTTRSLPFNSRHTLQQRFTETLTPRQREILQAAYQSGYFESPRAQSGTELSDLLDISQSTFTHHLREAERKLFDMVLDH